MTENVQLSKEEQMVAFFVRTAASDLGRTQLMKFLYLADYEARRLLGRSISGLKYIWYHHGPYDENAVKAMSHLDDLKIIHESTVMYPNGRISYRYNRGVLPAALDGFSAIELQILKHVSEEYSKYSLDDLLEWVYDTEPMVKAKEQKAFNKPLDMKMMDNSKRDMYGITFEELFDRIQRVQAGEFRTHADVMSDMRKITRQHAAA